MKKSVAIITSVFCSFFGFSQERTKGDMELTPKLGVIFANYYSSEKLTNESVSNLNIGAELDTYINSRWSFRTGLLLQGMGSEIGGTNHEETLTYLTIPLNANWHFGSTRKWNLNFGPSVGFITSAKATYSDNIKEYVETSQIGLNFGIGYKIEVNKSFGILIDYQGMVGLTDIQKANNNFSIKNVYDSFNVGAVIKL